MDNTTLSSGRVYGLMVIILRNKLSNLSSKPG